jgi:adenylate cyclase
MKTIIKKYFTLTRTSIFGFIFTLVIFSWEMTQGLNPLLDTSLNRLEYFFYDMRYRVTLQESKHTSENNIVILDIDEKSLKAEGRWPWSRVKIGELVESLAEQGAVVVAFDIVFSERERNPATEILENYPIYHVEDELKKIEEIADADKVFARSFQKMDVILGYFFDFEESKIGALPPAVYKLSEEILDGFAIQSMPGLISNLPVLQDAARGAGSVTTIPDADGVIRRSPLVIPYKGDLYPSLSLAAGMAYLFAEEIELRTAELAGLTSITAIGISEFPARTDASGKVLVPYIGKQKSFPYISATDVLNENVEPGSLEGGIVLVGTSALGLKDLRTTPLQTSYPGVEVHANILKGLLEGGIPFQPDWEPLFMQFLIIVVGFMLAGFMPHLSSLPMVLTGLGTLGLYLTFNYYLWSVSRFDLSQSSLIILISGITVINIAVGFFQESSRKKELKDMFGQYVPPAHIDRMVDAENEEDAFASDTREMTVLFSDIRSFTSISEGLSAEELKQMLNEYFTPITQVIFENEGTIDKYVGDMVMAFWGAPLEDPDHRLHALEAALAMLQKTEELKAEFRAKGFPEINIGVGLNTGQMNVGDMGSQYRRAYTVLGDAVNLSSRLESLTKFYGARCLVGEETIKGIEQYVFREIDCIQVKGKEEPVNVFEPIGKISDLSEAQLEELSDYTRALDDYRSQRWDEAKAGFEKLKEKGEQRIYEIYLERIEEMRVADLPADWDATYRHVNK